MYTDTLRPTAMDGATLDRFLEDGWFRIGHTLITCDHLSVDDDLHAVVWARLDLSTYTFRASNRRRMRKLASRFEVRMGPRVVDEAHEAVYQRYLTVAPGERAESLAEFLGDILDGEGKTGSELFETRELSVWEGDRLVAFHWCDVGETAVMSLLGAYDPEYSKHSLGFATLLVEVAWAQEQGYRWFYPGYVVPGVQSMSYKRQLGQLEGLDPTTRAWVPMDEVDPETLPLRRLDRALGLAQAALLPDVHSERKTYGFHALPARNPKLAAFLDQPRFLVVHSDMGDQLAMLVTWDPVTETYQLIRARCIPHKGLTREGQELVVDLWHREAVLHATTVLDDLVRTVRDRVGPPRLTW